MTDGINDYKLWNYLDKLRDSLIEKREKEEKEKKKTDKFIKEVINN